VGSHSIIAAPSSGGPPCFHSNDRQDPNNNNSGFNGFFEVAPEVVKGGIHGSDGTRTYVPDTRPELFGSFG